MQKLYLLLGILLISSSSISAFNPELLMSEDVIFSESGQVSFLLEVTEEFRLNNIDKVQEVVVNETYGVDLFNFVLSNNESLELESLDDVEHHLTNTNESITWEIISNIPHFATSDKISISLFLNGTGLENDENINIFKIFIFYLGDDNVSFSFEIVSTDRDVYSPDSPIITPTDESFLINTNFLYLIYILPVYVVIKKKKFKIN